MLIFLLAASADSAMVRLLHHGVFRIWTRLQQELLILWEVLVPEFWWCFYGVIWRFPVPAPQWLYWFRPFLLSSHVAVKIHYDTIPGCALFFTGNAPKPLKLKFAVALGWPAALGSVLYAAAPELGLLLWGLRARFPILTPSARALYFRLRV